MHYLLPKLLLTLLVIVYPHSAATYNLSGDKINNVVVDKTLVKELYNSLQIKSLPYEVFELAYTGYSKLKEQNLLHSSEILTIIDYSKSSREKRLFVINLTARKLIYNELVAHGMNTGADYAKKFSNQRHSNQSSLGFFLTGEPYNGDRGYSLKLYGLEKNFNDNAFARGVIMHGASYVSEKFIKQNGRLGRSFGCTAVSEEVNSEIIQTIKGGTCMFIYYPDKNYLSKSQLVKENERNVAG